MSFTQIRSRVFCLATDGYHARNAGQGSPCFTDRGKSSCRRQKPCPAA
ncbi:hypothetical protein [Leyella lascolaii]|nr:hypothetical protein [Leyella lascolaii]